jgi:hypothetical protein
MWNVYRFQNPMGLWWIWITTASNPDERVIAKAYWLTDHLGPFDTYALAVEARDKYFGGKDATPTPAASPASIGSRRIVWLEIRYPNDEIPTQKWRTLERSIGEQADSIEARYDPIGRLGFEIVPEGKIPRFIQPGPSAAIEVGYEAETQTG